VRRLTGAYRAGGDTVVWILHAEPGTGTVFDPDKGFVRMMDGLDAAAGGAVLDKTSHKPFPTPDLPQHPTPAGHPEHARCGIRTEQCVESTARMASDLGYDVTFVIDATATNPIEHRDAPPNRSIEEILADPRTLQTDEILARTEYALAGRFVTIGTVDGIV